MRYASSIRYGGQLIDASDVDYQAYKHLGLLCPNCKEPIFLQGMSQRSHPTKLVEVPAHFKHFAAKDPALAKECEARVAKYDQKELERRAASARGQRLKLLQRWFWSIVVQHPKFGDMAEITETLESNSVLLAKLKIEYLPRIVDTASTMRDAFKKEINTSLSSLFDRKQLDANMLDALFIGVEDSRTIYELTKKIVAQIDRSMQIMMSGEVVDFLLSKSSKGLLTNFLSLELTRFMLGIKRIFPSCKFDFDEKFLYKANMAMVLGMLMTIATTPWAEEFAKLQHSTARGQVRC